MSLKSGNNEGKKHFFFESTGATPVYPESSVSLERSVVCVSELGVCIFLFPLFKHWHLLPFMYLPYSSSSSLVCLIGGKTESNTQQLSTIPSTSSSSSYSNTPPPLFPSPLFHTYLSAQQLHSTYPPGYPPATPIWTLPAPQGTPIPSLCSSTTTSSPIPRLIPQEWYKYQRKKKDRCVPAYSIMFILSYRCTWWTEHNVYFISLHVTFCHSGHLKEHLATDAPLHIQSLLQPRPLAPTLTLQAALSLALAPEADQGILWPFYRNVIYSILHFAVLHHPELKIFRTDRNWLVY